MRGKELVALATEIAQDAHAGQIDKAGAPYIGHPARVAASARDRAGEPQADLVEAAAWLHDVVEDTDVTLDDLIERDVPRPVVTAVDALTRRPGEKSEMYYSRVAADPIALVVKLADLADNSDPDRLVSLDEGTQARLTAKYEHARATLNELTASPAQDT